MSSTGQVMTAERVGGAYVPKAAPTLQGSERLSHSSLNGGESHLGAATIGRRLPHHVATRGPQAVR